MCNIAKFNSFLTSATDQEIKKWADIRFIKEADISIGGWCDAGLMSVLNYAITYCLDPGEQYLEIGTFTGRSLIGALKDNNVQSVVIDPFIDGIKVFQEWSNNVEKFNVKDRIVLHNEPCELFVGQLPPIGVFFYDGNHDSGHTYEGLKRFEKYLSNKAIIIVDDYYIFGGNEQKVFPGHQLDVNTPVKTDVSRWLRENTNKASLLDITPWCNGQAIIIYE